MLTEEEIRDILKNLSYENNFFYMEADFQVSLAKKIEENILKAHPNDRSNVKITLEHLFNSQSIDIFTQGINGQSCAIELKYYVTVKPCNRLYTKARKEAKAECEKAEKARNGLIENNGLIEFGLKSGANGLMRREFWKDIKKLELATKASTDKGIATIGYAIFLTNDMTFWSLFTQCGYKQESNDAKYKINNERNVIAGEVGEIENCYDLKWESWGENGFKYLLLKVPPKS